MANTKKLNDPIQISVKIEREQLDLLKENGINNRSVFFRDCVYNYNENHKSNLNELKNELKNLENQKKLIENEIIQLKKQIETIENKEKENTENTEIINNIMETINKIANNENGITRKRINFICNNKIDSNYIINECRKQGIKIILENERQTAKNGKDIINIKTRSKTKHNKKPMETILNLFNLSYNSQKAYKEPLKYLKANENHYKELCQKKELNYNDFEKRIKKRKH